MARPWGLVGWHPLSKPVSQCAAISEVTTEAWHQDRAVAEPVKVMRTLLLVS